jgi:hypothetical protein
MSRTSLAPELGRIALGLFAAAAPLYAQQQVCHTAVVPSTATDFEVDLGILEFDPALGTLLSVDVVVEVDGVAVSLVESTSSSANSASVVPGVTAEVLASDDTLLATASTTHVSTLALGVYDGVTDYGGTSGATITATPLPLATDSASTTDGGVLDLFAGTPGMPSASGARVRVFGIGTATGSGSLLSTFASDASVTVTICYVYTPRVTSTCAGDGTGTACPCDNNGAAGEGCANSYGWGSLLGWTGGASVSADTFTLSATVPGSNMAMFFQGTAAANGGAGAVFGDGLRCTDGTVIRLVTTAASGGVAQFPATGDPLVSVAGEVGAGHVRWYQVWYRNAAEFCTEDTFNLSNALRVEWGS